MLDLEDDPDAAVAREIEDVAQAQYGIDVVVRGARGPDRRDALAAAEGLQLRPREVLREPAVRRSPSITFDVRRAANSARVETSVVAEISFSCRTTSTPSFEGTTSGSTASTPAAIARR